MSVVPRSEETTPFLPDLGHSSPTAAGCIWSTAAGCIWSTAAGCIWFRCLPLVPGQPSDTQMIREQPESEIHRQGAEESTAARGTGLATTRVLFAPFTHQRCTLHR